MMLMTSGIDNTKRKTPMYSEMLYPHIKYFFNFSEFPSNTCPPAFESINVEKRNENVLTMRKDIGILTDKSYELNCGKTDPMKKTDITIKKEIRATSI